MRSFIVLVVLLLATPAPADPVRVLAIGDSITWGIVSGSGGLGYVDLLADALGVRYEVTTAACAGSIAPVWRPAADPATCFGQFDGELVDYWDVLIDPALPADIATIMLGTNDAQVGAPRWIYLGSLIQIIDELLALGVGEVILMTPPPHPSGFPLLASYSDGIPDLCETIDGLTCGPDVYRLLDPVADFAAGNGHPNATGHAKIASALGAYIVSPEPSTASLVLLGLVVLGCQRHLGSPS